MTWIVTTYTSTQCSWSCDECPITMKEGTAEQAVQHSRLTGHTTVVVDRKKTTHRPVGVTDDS